MTCAENIESIIDKTYLMTYLETIESIIDNSYLMICLKQCLENTITHPLVTSKYVNLFSFNNVCMFSK